MILVDTNAWVRHLRRRDARLVTFLTEGRVVTCDVVLGELTLGSGVPAALLKDLNLLPKIPVPSAAETRAFIERHRRIVAASGIGWADAQLLVAATVAGARLCSHDGPMKTVWRKLGFKLA